VTEGYLSRLPGPVAQGFDPAVFSTVGMSYVAGTQPLVWSRVAPAAYFWIKQARQWLQA
jgi:hypothetical protein